MSNENIIHSIVKSMTVAQREKLENKKEFVMNILSKSMTQEAFERYRPYISITIDMLKAISKDENILKGLKNKKCLFSCTNI